MPDEYVEYVLCKTFHCLPSQLDNENDYKLNIFLEIMSMENEESLKEMKRAETKNRLMRKGKI